MCSLPVTFGGGMTIEKLFAPSIDGRENTPSRSQYSLHTGSYADGSKRFESSDSGAAPEFSPGALSFFSTFSASA
ncbi:MAG: hypothetical protein BWY28_02881 [bacterium ADurb.Bin236]|nr:MAG: hypothetical protein BWY28_02881 [bacterium ADurb.Bin236]